MTGAPERRNLDTLARRCGIQRRYVDGVGTRRVASTDAVLAALTALGHDVRAPEDAATEWRRLDAEAAERIIEPVVVLWRDGSPTGVPVGPAAMDAERLDVRLAEENGREHAWHARTDELIRGDARAPILPLPEAVPEGIHTLSITAGARTQEGTLLVAPSKCWRPARYRRDTHTDVGVFLPLYAVRREGNLGVGNLGDLDRLTTWAGSLGCVAMGTLPLLSTFLDEPFDPSPYAPVSRSIFGELFIDVRDAAERSELPTLRALLSSPEMAGEIDRVRGQELVDYAASWRLVRRCLEAAASDAFASDALRAQIERFQRDNPLIAQYARFRAQLAETGAGTSSPEAEHRLFLCAQWLLAGQLQRIAGERKAAGCGLYLDLPVGAHRDGFDSWRAPALHAPGVAMGAPPDDLFQRGQNWGFPPVIPEQSRAMGHRPLAEALDRHLRLASALRIDHAAGLHRCYWVPDGGSATDGLYVHYPAEEYYALLSILSHRHEAVIVGENLGTIPRYVDRGLRRRGALGMSIGQFELGAAPDRPLPAPAPRTLAALNTHDMPPFAAHWSGEDLPLLARLGVIDEADVEPARRGRQTARQRTIHALRTEGLLEPDTDDPCAVLEALLIHLSRGSADLLMVNIEDLWLETRPQNVPGVVEGYPSWRRRAARTLEWITADPEIQSTIRRLAGAAGGGPAASA